MNEEFNEENIPDELTKTEFEHWLSLIKDHFDAVQKEDDFDEGAALCEEKAIVRTQRAYIKHLESIPLEVQPV